MYSNFFVALFVLSLCLFDMSVGVGDFVIGLSQTSSYFLCIIKKLEIIHFKLTIIQFEVYNRQFEVWFVINIKLSSESVRFFFLQKLLPRQKRVFKCQYMLRAFWRDVIEDALSWLHHIRAKEDLWITYVWQYKGTATNMCIHIRNKDFTLRSINRFFSVRNSLKVLTSDIIYILLRHRTKRN